MDKRAWQILTDSGAEDPADLAYLFREWAVLLQPS